MPEYKSRRWWAVDTYKRWDNAEKLSGRVGYIAPRATITASDKGSVLLITRGTHAGWYVYQKDFLVVPVTPSPQPVPIPNPTSPPSGVILCQFLAAPNPREAAQTLNSAPDVVILSEGQGRVQMTRAWQDYLVAINPGMKRNHVAALLNRAKAFANKTGFPTDDGDPIKANYINGGNPLDEMRYPNPELDKDRVCSFACVRGVVDKDSMLRLMTLDGNMPPPPFTVINPKTHPEYYFHATMVYKKGTIDPFPNAAPAPLWGYNRPVVLFPLVATHEIRVPLSMVRQVQSYQLPYTNG